MWMSDEIIVYDPAHDFKEKRRIDIKHHHFEGLDRFPLSMENLGKHDGPFLGPKNQQLLTFGNDWIGLIYFDGISENKLESKLVSNENYNGSTDHELHHMILFQNGKQVSNEIPLSDGKVTLGLPENRLLINKPASLKIEDNFVQYDIYEWNKQ